MTYVTITLQAAEPGVLRDHWAPHETLHAAREAFESAKARDNVYTASLCAVLDSTDYAGAPDLVSLLERLAGFAAHYASDSAMRAGGDALVVEAYAAVRAARGEQ